MGTEDRATGATWLPRRGTRRGSREARRRRHGASRVLRAVSLLALLLPALAVLGVSGAGAAPAPTNALDWPNYGNDPGGMRYVDVDQITPANVAQLQPAWILHTGVMSELTSFESQPIIVDGTLYISSPHDHVFAVDAATGAIKWTYNPEMPALSQIALCCGQTNRGVAVGKGKVFIGQLDATLVALDAKTGAVAWRVEVDRWQDKWSETMAPQYIDGKVLIGASGGEFEKRGHFSAYDAETGKLLWRFYTTPATGQSGNDTWSGDSWRTGGGTVWTTPNIDPKLGLVYIQTGNAAPDENGSERAGQNLYTVSIVALDLNTGQYRWHFQEVHHDLWDYDTAQPAHLFTLTRGGQQIPALGHANKNGNYFVLDRRDGKPLYDVTEVPVPTEPAWQHPSPTQPMPATEPLIPQSVAAAPPGFTAGPMWTPPHEQPTLIQPGFEAGPEWGAAAYSPRTKYAYIPAGGYEPWNYHAQQQIVNSLGSTGFGNVPGIEQYGLFDAMDTTTGKIAWKIQTPEKTVTGTVVAGDLVFFGEVNGKFNAVDAKTGKVLWTFKTDMTGVGGANGSPAVYEVDGHEYVVMAFGGNFRQRLDAGKAASPPGDALIAFALPSGGQWPNIVTATPKQVEVGAPKKVPGVASAPAGATVIDIQSHDLNYFPHQFTVAPGQRVAVHLTNVDITPVGFAVKLPSGAIQLAEVVKPKEDAFFVFTAPDQPGDYAFFSPGAQQYFGLTGVMRVAAQPLPGMPNTGGGFAATGSGAGLVGRLSSLALILATLGLLVLTAAIRGRPTGRARRTRD